MRANRAREASEGSNGERAKARASRRSSVASPEHGARAGSEFPSPASRRREAGSGAERRLQQGPHGFKAPADFCFVGGFVLRAREALDHLIVEYLDGREVSLVVCRSFYR